MPRTTPTAVNVYLEIGARRTFAAALDWPGWCRAGRDEPAALRALWEYGPRYAHSLRPARLGFAAPAAPTAFVIVERLKGNVTTDFGAPDVVPAGDTAPLDDAELRRLQAILKAGWRALDAAAEAAQGRTLRAGPRGGGRTLDGLVAHVLGAETGYLSKLGGQAPAAGASSEALRQAILQTLAASAQGAVAAYEPRGGKRWPPRFFVRREVWHVLDHVWEIEDRLAGPAK